MSSKNNHFTASDIERYHSGKMSPQERHALEKAALDDPFLADALEGYSYTTTAANDLEKIKSRLNSKHEKKKTIPLFTTYRWLSAAAIIIILAGAAWFAYSNFNNQKTSLANNAPLQEEKKVEPINNSSSNKTADTSPTNQQTVLVNKTRQTDNSSQEKQASASPKKTPSKKINKEIASSPAQDETAKTNSISPSEITLNKSLEPSTAFKASATKPNFDTTNNEVAKNEVASNIKNRSAKTDTIKNFNVTLQSKQPQLDEVVVVGNGVHKKAVPKYPRVIIDTLEPKEGYDEFDDYISENLKMPEEIKTKTVSGEIQLSFDVDEEGKPTNIAIVKSLCNECDEEAIRLLKEGPKWKKKKNKKGKLTIRF